MKYLKNLDAVIITAVLVAAALIVRSASGADNFMDLESSIRELQQLVDRTGPGIVTVISYDESGEENGRGSGFFMDRDGRILTNASVVKGAYSAEVISRSSRYINVTILSRNDALDLALIHVRAKGEVPLALDNEYTPSSGERVVVIGNSASFRRTVSEGLVSSVDREDETMVLMNIQTIVPLLSYRASKDGMVLNMAGKVLGLVSTEKMTEQSSDGIKRIPDYNNLKAVVLSNIMPFLSGQGSEERLRPAKSAIRSQWLLRVVKTAAAAAFVYLYDKGFSKIVQVIFLAAVVIAILQWLFVKLKNMTFGK